MPSGRFASTQLIGATSQLPPDIEFSSSVGTLPRLPGLISKCSTFAYWIAYCFIEIKSLKKLFKVQYFPW